jgi:hypothetical protein
MKKIKSKMRSLSQTTCFVFCRSLAREFSATYQTVDFRQIREEESRAITPGDLNKVMDLLLQGDISDN